MTPAALTDGTRTVTASVTDPAGNEGIDSQELTVDTAAPAVTITGGRERADQRRDPGHLRHRGRRRPARP